MHIQKGRAKYESLNKKQLAQNAATELYLWLMVLDVTNVHLIERHLEQLNNYKPHDPQVIRLTKLAKDIANHCTGVSAKSSWSHLYEKEIEEARTLSYGLMTLLE